MRTMQQITPYKLIEIIKKKLDADPKFLDRLFEQTPYSVRTLEQNSTFESLMNDLISKNQFIFSGKLPTIDPNLEIFSLIELSNCVFGHSANWTDENAVGFIKREILHILQVNKPDYTRINERIINWVNSFLFAELERNAASRSGTSPLLFKGKVPLARDIYPELKKHLDYFKVILEQGNSGQLQRAL